MMTQALKVVLSSSRSTGASVSPLLVARTAPEGREKQRLAMRKQVSFKTLSKLNSEDGVRELAKVWSGSNGDGEDETEQNDQGPSPLQQTRSLLLQKKSVSFRLTKDTTPRPHRLLITSRTVSSLTTAPTEITPVTPVKRFSSLLRYICGRRRRKKSLD